MIQQAGPCRQTSLHRVHHFIAIVQTVGVYDYNLDRDNGDCCLPLVLELGTLTRTQVMIGELAAKWCGRPGHCSNYCSFNPYFS